jgi:hypothetical protein
MPRVRRTCAQMSSASDTDEKACVMCARVLPSTCYYVNTRSQTHGTKCKDCISDYGVRKRAAERADSDISAQDDEEHPKRLKHNEPSDLYVMALSTDPDGSFHGLKVGRSGNISQRALGLSESMPFNILILATFPGLGYLEKAVHIQLGATRNENGRGREWFRVQLPTVLYAVTCAMQSCPKVNA